MTNPPDEIRRDGKNFYSEERLNDWYPHVAKYTAKHPLETVLAAIGRRFFTENGVLYYIPPV